jgi:hypothetical protein
LSGNGSLNFICNAEWTARDSNAFSANGDIEKLQNHLLSRPRAASTMLRMIIRRLLGAARLTTMRMQQPIPSASKLASGLAADPQHWPDLAGIIWVHKRWDADGFLGG